MQLCSLNKENSDVEEGRKTLQTLEEEVQRLHNEISDLQMAIVLQELIGNAESQQSIAKMIKGLQRKFKNYGCRLTPVRMANGTVVELVVSYYARPCNERMVKKRGLGFYPALLLLGIFDGCSPSLASEVSKAVAALASIKEAQQMLASRGCKLDSKTIRNIAKRFAARARASQESGELFESITRLCSF